MALDQKEGRSREKKREFRRSLYALITSLLFHPIQGHVKEFWSSVCCDSVMTLLWRRRIRRRESRYCSAAASPSHKHHGICCNLHSCHIYRHIMSFFKQSLLVTTVAASRELYFHWLFRLLYHKWYSGQFGWLFFVPSRIRLCMVASTFFGSTLFLLSFFEPLNIAFETLLALTVHGFYSTEIWKRRSIDNGAYCLASLDFYKSIEAAGFFAGQKGTLNRNCSFLLDFLALSMSVGHYLMIWWLQGTSFFLVNTVVFVYLCRILNKMVKRVRCFINLKNDPISIGEAFPDATDKDLSVFDDQCAICRGPMAKAKKLPCNHLFHLDCLKLWLDQGCTEAYSCPTCRGLLFVSSSENQTNSLASQVSNNAHIAASINPFPAGISIQPSTR